MRGYLWDKKDAKPHFFQGSDYNGMLEQFDFLSLICNGCLIIIEKGESLKEDGEKRTLAQWLYFLLNCPPKAKAFKLSYDDMFEKQGHEPLRQSLYQRIINKELRQVLPIVHGFNMIYGTPEIDIAEMHFSGAIGLDRKRPEDYKSCSLLTKQFDFNAYKQIRAASTVDELMAVESTDTKYSFLHILIGHYIDWYARLLTDVITKANFGILIKDVIDPEARIESIIEKVTTRDELKTFLPNTKQRVNASIKKHLLKDYCKQGVLSDLSQMLYEIEKQFKIGTKACSKKEFAQIAWVIKEYCRVLKITKYKPCKAMLTNYYGVPSSEYKIRDASDFLKTPDGRSLRKKIETFCSEHEKYCYR